MELFAGFLDFPILIPLFTPSQAPFFLCFLSLAKTCAGKSARTKKYK